MADNILEIRSYILKPGTRDQFHAILRDHVVAQLADFGIAVVRYGPSLHDDVSYVLIRAFNSLAERDRKEEAFYTSDIWRTGWREAVLARIEHYHEIVLAVDGDMIPLWNLLD